MRRGWWNASNKEDEMVRGMVGEMVGENGWRKGDGDYTSVWNGLILVTKQGLELLTRSLSSLSDKIWVN